MGAAVPAGGNSTARMSEVAVPIARCNLRPVGAAIGNLDGEVFLAPAQGGKTRNRSVQPRKREQIGYHPGGLAQGELEETLDRKSDLDGIRRGNCPRTVS